MVRQTRGQSFALAILLTATACGEEEAPFFSPVRAGDDGGVGDGGASSDATGGSEQPSAPKPRPVAPKGQLTVADYGMGRQTVVLCGLSDGILRCWNGGTELETPPGTYDFVDCYIGKTMRGLPGDFEDVQCCAIDTEGAMHCFPHESDAPSDVRWKMISMMDGTRCGITVDDKILCWKSMADMGYNTLIWQPPPTEDAIDLDVDEGYGCAVMKEDGRIECFGLLTFELGAAGQYAVYVDMLTPPDGEFTMVTVGKQETYDKGACALAVDGSAHCWTMEISPPPVANIPPHADYVMLTGGAGGNSSYTCGIRSGLNVECWGFGGVATYPPDDEGFATIDGDRRICGLTPARKILCWSVPAFGDRPPEDFLRGGDP